MTAVTVESHGKIALLRLTNRVTNAIGPALVADLSTALLLIATDFRGCVLAGGSKFFSIGLDLPALVQLNRQEMSRFWDDFDQAVLDRDGDGADGAVPAHGQAARGLDEQNPDVAVIATGRVEDAARHHRVAARLEHQRGSNPVVLGHEVLLSIEHAVAFQRWCAAVSLSPK